MVVTLESGNKQYLYRRKFTTTQEEPLWSVSSITDLGLPQDVAIVGLININGNAYAVSRDSKLFDIDWNDDTVAIKESVSCSSIIV